MAQKSDPRSIRRGLLGEDRANPLGRIRSRKTPDRPYGSIASNSLGVTDAEMAEDIPSYSQESVRDYESKIPEPEPKKTWRQTDRQLCVLVILCSIVIMVLVILCFIFYLQPKLYKVDISAHGVTLGGDVLVKMELIAKPCEDFYQYSCGRFLTNQYITPDNPSFGVFEQTRLKIAAILKKLLDKAGSVYMGETSTAIQKAKTYYQTCMNTTAVEALGDVPMQKLIKAIGSWPLVSNSIMGTWNKANWTLEMNLAKSSLLGGDGLFTLDVDVDYKNNSIYIMTFDQSGLTLPSYSLYLGNNTGTYRQAYLDLFKGVTTLLGASKADSQQAGEDLWQFEAKLAEFFVKNENLQNIWDQYNKMTLEELQDNYFGTFNVSTFVFELFNKNIPMDEEVLVIVPSYFKQMSHLVEQTPKTVLANYLVWRTISGLFGSMPEVYQAVLDKLREVINGVTSRAPLWKSCVDQAQTLLPFATGALYVDRHFPESKIDQIQTMVKYIFDAFEDSLPQVTWMDAITKTRAMEKLQTISTKIGYPSLIKDPKQLDDYYKELELQQNEQLYNVLAGSAFVRGQSLSLLGRPVDRNQWFMGPAFVNAYYNVQFNEIVLPAGILQEPYFGSQFPMAINFGSIGSIVGHELTHGFDMEGSDFDKAGNLVDWWTRLSRTNFIKQTRCLVDQYSRYRVGSSHVNGVTTLNENIADNGGVRIGFHAYMQWLKQHDDKDPGYNLPGLDPTKRQLFFIAFAQIWCRYYTPEYALDSLTEDPHAYSKYRVIGPLANFDKFSDAFHCGHYGLMKSNQSCVVW